MGLRPPSAGGGGPQFKVNAPVANKPTGKLRGFAGDFGGGTQIDPVIFLALNIDDSGGGGSKEIPYFGSLKWSMEDDYEPVLGQRQMEQYPELWSVGDQQTGLTARRMYKWRPFEFYAQTTTNKTTLSGAVTAGATSIVVASATGITAAGPTLDTVGGVAQGDKLLIEDADPTKKEIVKVSNVAGTTLTVDALAFPHADGTVIYRLAGRAQFASVMQFAHGKNGISLYEFGDAIDGTLDVSTYLIKRGLLKMFPFADVNTVLDLQAGGTTSTAAVQLGYGGTQSVYNLLTENATTVRLKIGGLTNSFRFYASNNGVAQALNANLNDAVQSLVVTATGGYGLRVRGIAAHAAHLVRFEPLGATTPTSGVDQNGAVFQYVKNTAGAPATGTWELGSTVVNTSDSKIYVCTVAGTPGTWKSVAIA